MERVPAEHALIVRSALNSGATFDRVMRVEPTGSQYRVHGDFYRILARIRGRMLSSSATLPQVVAVVEGGSLASKPDELEARIDHNRQLTHEAGSAPQAGPASYEDMRDVILAELLDGVGVPLSAYERLRDERVAQAALAAGDALHRMADRNDDLHETLLLRERSWASQLEHRHDELLERLKDESAALPVIDELTAIIDHLRPALLLSPEAGLLDELIEALETAAGSDDLKGPIEQMLLKQLKALQSDDLASEGTWRRARDLIEHFEADSPMSRPN